MDILEQIRFYCLSLDVPCGEWPSAGCQCSGSPQDSIEVKGALCKTQSPLPRGLDLPEPSPGLRGVFGRSLHPLAPWGPAFIHMPQDLQSILGAELPAGLSGVPYPRGFL